MIRWCPYGTRRSRLWVRETWSYYEHHELFDCIRYKADEACIKPDFRRHAITDTQGWQFEQQCDGPDPDHRWRSPIHMPRWASRITLEITGVRVERLQDITRLDIAAEGWPYDERQAEGVTMVEAGLDDAYIDDASIEWFADLWDASNANHGHGWDANPWVWVIEFRRLP